MSLFLTLEISKGLDLVLGHNLDFDSTSGVSLDCCRDISLEWASFSM